MLLDKHTIWNETTQTEKHNTRTEYEAQQKGNEEIARSEHVQQNEINERNQQTNNQTEFDCILRQPAGSVAARCR